MPTINVFPLQRQIIKRERSAGSYRASSAFFAKVASTIPTIFAGALILGIPIYWMIGLQPDATKYLTFLCILLVHVFTANSLGLLIGAAVPNVTVGQIIGPLILVIFLIFGGLFVNLNTVPQVFRWIQWISFLSYTNKAFNQNEFTNLELAKCIPGAGTPCYSTGSDVITAQGLGTPTLWACVGINLGLSVVCLIMGYLAFARTSRPLLRLK